MKLVFDLGGVVFYWAPRLFVAELCGSKSDEPKLESAFNAVFQNSNGESDWLKFDRGQLSTHELATRIYQRLCSLKIDFCGTESLVVEWVQSLPAKLTPIEETVAWVEQLRLGGHELYYLSNMPKQFSLYLQGNTKVFDNFTEGIFSCDIGIAKPEIEIFQKAKVKFNISDSDRVIFIDDLSINVSAARTFGWDAVHHRCILETKEIVKRLTDTLGS
jgi:putative hydrolase of the HAD superfamily